VPDKAITKVGLDVLEKAVDKLFAKVGIDVEFTRHFLDRVNDSRNKKQITIRELAFLFKKTYHKHGKSIAKLGPDIEAVLKDLETDINIPFALNWNRRDQELELVSKTVMRKPNFKTPDRQFKVESVNRALDALGKKYRQAAESGDSKKADRIMKLIQNKSGKYGTSDLENHPDAGKFPKGGKIKEGRDDLQEGVNDPGIFKAVFLAGGSGSGKSYVLDKSGLGAYGLKNINSDTEFERALKRAGIEISKDNLMLPKSQKIRRDSKELTLKGLDLRVHNRMGLVIDGTGRDYHLIKGQAEALQELGYDVIMIYVNVTKETAIRRNAGRKRELPTKMVSQFHDDVQRNIPKFRKLFKNNMMIIDNNDGADIDTQTMNIFKKVGRWTKHKPTRPEAVRWIADQKRRRGLKEDSMNEEHGAGFEGSDELTKNYVRGTPNQPALRYLKNRKKQKVEEGIFDNLGGKGLGGLITKAKERGKPYHKAVEAYKKAVDANGSKSGRKKTHAALAASIAGMYDFHIRSFIKFLKGEIKTKRLETKYDVGAITEDADSGATTTASIPDPAGLNMKKQLLGFRAYDKRRSLKNPPRVLKRPVPNV